jgi:hypothetical protein
VFDASNDLYLLPLTLSLDDEMMTTLMITVVVDVVDVAAVDCAAAEDAVVDCVEEDAMMGPCLLTSVRILLVFLWIESCEHHILDLWTRSLKTRAL